MTEHLPRHKRMTIFYQMQGLQRWQRWQRREGRFCRLPGIRDRQVMDERGRLLGIMPAAKEKTEN